MKGERRKEKENEEHIFKFAVSTTYRAKERGSGKEGCQHTNIYNFS